MDIAKYARAAYKLVVPEYNRAHIQKVSWGLDDIPSILPNKMDINGLDFNVIPNSVRNCLEILKKENRKIILYQGVLGKDRNIEEYADAIDMISDSYALVILGKITNDFNVEDFLKRHKVIFLPYIESPNHLYITKQAYIGLLPYKAEKIAHLSVLNAVFCAPNKIYEYAAFGIPMIGSEVPGLSHLFWKYECGIPVKNGDKEGILKAIECIEDNYSQYASHSLMFYEHDNYDEIVENIIS